MMNSITEPSKEHLREMMTWFTKESELREWAGPNFNYPYDLRSFSHDLSLDKLASFSLVSEHSTLLAFGQCYSRVGRWHLARLVVSPAHRGQGVIQELIEHLSEFGRKQHNIRSNSLFVLHENSAAINAYQRCGFIMADYPQAMSMDNTHYMVREQSSDNRALRE